LTTTNLTSRPLPQSPTEKQKMRVALTAAAKTTQAAFKATSVKYGSSSSSSSTFLFFTYSNLSACCRPWQWPPTVQPAEQWKVDYARQRLEQCSRRNSSDRFRHGVLTVGAHITKAKLTSHGASIRGCVKQRQRASSREEVCEEGRQVRGQSCSKFGGCVWRPPGAMVGSGAFVSALRRNVCR